MYAVPADGAVVDCQRAAVGDAAAKAGAIPGNGAVIDYQLPVLSAPSMRFRITIAYGHL